MKYSIASGGLVLASLAGSALAGATYTLSESIVGEGFYSSFNFEAIADTTHGRVNYVSEATAQSLNLTYATSNTFIMRADDTTVLSASGPGRNSVRIRSNNQYTTHVAVFDMQHMPQGCGTWPAVWETNEANWPNGGEVDIVEGVNDVMPNQSTLHTGANCSIPASGVNQLGTTIGTDCYVNDNGNVGCGVRLTEDNNSFGPDFNNIGGGWYAFERTNNYISVWFWERGDASAPTDATTGASTVNTNNWGTPAAYFPNTDCDLATHFDAHNIIINLTFCGDWAGSSSVYAASGCPSTCVGAYGVAFVQVNGTDNLTPPRRATLDYVNNNPTAFTDAYFEFSSIHIYQ